MNPRIVRVLGIAAALVAVAVIVVVLRSGGGKDGGDRLGDATNRLVNSCIEKREADRPLCQCIADELVASQGLATAQALDRAREAVEDGKRPAKVVSAAKACRGNA